MAQMAQPIQAAAPAAPQSPAPAARAVAPAPAGIGNNPSQLSSAAPPPRCNYFPFTMIRSLYASVSSAWTTFWNFVCCRREEVVVQIAPVQGPQLPSAASFRQNTQQKLEKLGQLRQTLATFMFNLPRNFAEVNHPWGRVPELPPAAELLGVEPANGQLNQGFAESCSNNTLDEIAASSRYVEQLSDSLERDDRPQPAPQAVRRLVFVSSRNNGSIMGDLFPHHQQSAYAFHSYAMHDLERLKQTVFSFWIELHATYHLPIPPRLRDRSYFPWPFAGSAHGPLTDAVAQTYHLEEMNLLQSIENMNNEMTAHFNQQMQRRIVREAPRPVV